MFSELTGETPPDNLSIWLNKRQIFTRNKNCQLSLMTIEGETKKYLMHVF